MTADRNDRRIFLGMPGYGRQTAAAGMAFWNATKARFVQRARGEQLDMNEYRCGSLLAANFNQLWCTCLNTVHQGKRLDYFAMLHDDVGPLACGPEHYWLDQLIDELEANDLDVLSVVVPIKDKRALTSTALSKGRYDRERSVWTDDVQDGQVYKHALNFCKLSLHDVRQLPETFTSDDLGKPLLLNTGCWVVKWNQEWCRKVHFEISDQIVFNTAANSYQPITWSEDWGFSAQCHELGLKIGATRKIKLNHRGEVDFPNYVDPYPAHPGSQSFDRETLRTSPVPGSHPSDIEGWLTEAEGKALAELARGKRVLEIGSFCGLSTVCIARTAEHVTACDYFDGRATPKPGDTRKAFDANLARYGVAYKVTVCHPDEPVLGVGEYDLVFIDGAHDRESVEKDINAATGLLTSDGLIAFHDYGHGDPGVVEAVNGFIANGATLISRIETLAVVRPPALIPLEV